MKTFALLGFFPVKPVLITVVRALDLHDAGRKLHGTIWSRNDLRADEVRLYDQTARVVACWGTDSTAIGDMPAWAAFRPSGDVARNREHPHDAKCVVNPTAHAIAEARRGASHDPFGGCDFEDRAYTDDHEAVRLKLFERFVLCPIPCVL